MEVRIKNRDVLPEVQGKGSTNPIQFRTRLCGVFSLKFYLQYKLEMSKISAYELELTKYAFNKMQELDFIDIHGENNNKHSIISFNLEKIHSHEVSSYLDVEGVAIRAGHHCCQPLMKQMKLNATARVSFGIYNTIEEIDTFISVLKNCRDFFKK